MLYHAQLKKNEDLKGRLQLLQLLLKQEKKAVSTWEGDKKIKKMGALTLEHFPVSDVLRGRLYEASGVLVQHHET